MNDYDRFNSLFQYTYFINKTYKQNLNFLKLTSFY